MLSVTTATSLLLAALSLIQNTSALPTAMGADTDPNVELVTIDGVQMVKIVPTNSSLDVRDTDASALVKRIGDNTGRSMSNAVDVWFDCRGRTCDSSTGPFAQCKANRRSTTQKRTIAIRMPLRSCAWVRRPYCKLILW